MSRKDKTMLPSIKIISIHGFGWVGQSVKKLFPEAIIYDPVKGYLNDDKTDIAFICVPTPLKNNTLDCSVVEQAVKKCKSDLIIIRSTVLPGTCDKLEKKGKNIVYQPEYLGETLNHPLFDETKSQFIILGGKPENRRKVIELYQQVYNANIKIRQVTNYEAEVIKLSENRAIAYKVAQCQELYDICEKAKVDYYTIRDAVYSDDPRFNLWFTFVYSDKRGMNSKCIPKDVYGWASWAESVGYKPELTNKLLEINDKLIRSNPIV